MKKNLCYTMGILFSLVFGSCFLGVITGLVYRFVPMLVSYNMFYLSLLYAFMGLLTYYLYAKYIRSVARAFDNKSEAPTALKITGIITSVVSLRINTLIFFLLNDISLRHLLNPEYFVYVKDIKYSLPKNLALIELVCAVSLYAFGRFLVHANKNNSTSYEEEAVSTVNFDSGRIKKYFTVVPLWVSIIMNVCLGAAFTPAFLLALFSGGFFILFILLGGIVAVLYNMLIYKIIKSIRSNRIYRKDLSKPSLVIRFCTIFGILVFMSGSFLWAQDLFLAINGWWF